MFKNKHKLQCEDRERKGNNDHSDSKKDVELCLEVEMDDEVRDIITSPEKCASTLLDVTVIKPKDIDQIYTAHKKTLNGEEVRKLITSMELQKDEQKKLINQILGKDETVVTIHKHGNFCNTTENYPTKNKHHASDKKRPKNVHCINSQESTMFFEQIQKISTTDVTNSDLSNGHKRVYKNCGDHERVEQVFTSPRTYNDLKALFTCKNKHKYEQNEKPNKPCLCQNCAILGLLNDAQKRPFVTENCFDPRDCHKRGGGNDKPKRKKSVNFKDEHLECEYYFRYLSSKIKTLEERIALQEERSVSRDYFKRIITKLVNHISRLTHGITADHNHSQKCKESHRCRDKIYDNTGHRYYIHPVLIDPKANKIPPERDTQSNIKHHPNPITPPQVGVNTKNVTNPHYESFWKWGEEILKPGIDLKNKIIDLLEETLQNLRRPRDNVSKTDGSIKNFVDEFSNKLYKTINEIPVKDVPSKKKANQESDHSPSSSSLSKKIDSVFRTEGPRSGKKAASKSRKNDKLMEEPLNVNVSYFNPKIKGWNEESQISFKFESSDLESGRPTDDRKPNDNFYRQEFMETIYNTKDADKLKLWQSIWNQAKANGQSRNDKVTIQIPNRTDLKKPKIIEIEYTIAELEVLLTGNNRCSLPQRGEASINSKK